MAKAITHVFLKAVHIHCCQHIADNLQQRYGNKVRQPFWRITCAKNEILFKKEMLKLREISKPAFQYLGAIDVELWTRAFRTMPCFGHNTFNIVKSINSL